MNTIEEVEYKSIRNQRDYFAWKYNWCQSSRRAVADILVSSTYYGNCLFDYRMVFCFHSHMEPMEANNLHLM